MIDIKSKSRLLKNGMRIIAMPDHRRPVVYIASMLDVGSKDEKIGHHGFAHLCEHLMFTGTPRIPDFDGATAIDGGTNNAWTNADNTCFLNHGPPILQETILTIEADRFLNLPTNLSEETFQTEKEVVLNELREDLDSSPFGDLHQRAYSALFGPNHPYGHPVIGKEIDLINASREDLQGFFKQTYQPDKMALIIAGDIDTTDCLNQAESLFAPLKRQSDFKIIQQKPQLISHQKEIIKEAVSTYPFLEIEWLTLGRDSHERHAMAILEILLGDSSQGILMKQLELNLELASQVECINCSQGLNGQLSISMVPNSNDVIPDIITAIYEMIQSIAANGVKPSLFEMAKKRVWLNWLFEWERLETRVEMALEWLMWNDTLLGIQEDAIKTLSLSQNAIQNIAKSMLARQPLVVKGLTQ